jgi:hypothetical protein
VGRRARVRRYGRRALDQRPMTRPCRPLEDNVYRGLAVVDLFEQNKNNIRRDCLRSGNGGRQ